MERFLNTTLIKIIEILLILALGVIIIKLLTKIIKRALLQSPIDNSIVGFILSALDLLLYFGLIIMMAYNLGIPLTTFTAILAPASVAISLAIKDSLSNVANGLIIVSTKPFKIGDHVQIGSVEGKIKNVKLLHTELVSFDNKKIIVPNNIVYNSEIINYSTNPTRRVDLLLTAKYGSDIDKIIKILEEIVYSTEDVLKSPAPVVRFNEQAASALVFKVMVWTQNNDYWKVYFSINERAYRRFMEENIEIPYNQLDVHIKED